MHKQTKFSKLRRQRKLSAQEELSKILFVDEGI